VPCRPSPGVELATRVRRTDTSPRTAASPVGSPEEDLYVALERPTRGCSTVAATTTDAPATAHRYARTPPVSPQHDRGV